VAVVTPVEALQKTLAAEHAAVHLYGVLGGQASKSQNPALFRQLDEAYDEHRASRDRLTVLINAKGKAPVAALVDYAVPGPTGTPSQIEAVARTIERRVTATYGELVENTAGADRAWAITALDASALRELGFGVAPSDFPGLG
jgi:uncharacterized protein DUF4439